MANTLALPPRLLILGISHHRKALAQGGIDPERGTGLTQAIVARHVADGTFRFFTLVRRMVLGPASTPLDRAPFWRSIAFYNLVQRLYDHPYEPVPPAHVRASHGAFTQVLELLRPSHVLVTGLDLWRQMPAAVAGHAVEGGGASRPTAIYGAGPHRTSAMAVPHPASFGFTYQPWHALIRTFLRLDQGGKV